VQQAASAQAGCLPAAHAAQLLEVYYVGGLGAANSQLWCIERTPPNQSVAPDFCFPINERYFGNDVLVPFHREDDQLDIA